MKIAASAIVISLALLSPVSGQNVDPRDRRAVKLLFDSWKLPVPPRHLIGNIQYVGAAGISSFLITTPQGHILIDTGFEDTVPLIHRNVEQLGYKPADIKYLLSSHTHADHTGGHAAMKRLTNATIVCSAADARILESGGEDDFSPFPRDFMKYTPIKADRIIEDGQTVELGGSTLTAYLTPGHTKGATTWTMPVMEDGRQYNVVFFSGISLVQGTKLVGNSFYPNIVDDYEATFVKLKKMPCDVFLAPHGGQFAMSEKFARLDRGEKPNPLIDPQGWQKMLADTEKAFATELAAQRANPAPEFPIRQRRSITPIFIIIYGCGHHFLNLN